MTRRGAAAPLVALLLVVAGCTTDDGGRAPSASSAPPTEPAVSSPLAEVMVDGPWYADVGELAAASENVVRVRVDSSEATMSYPDTSIYSSDDPELNPYAGTGRTPTAAEIKSMGMVATLNTVTVVDVVAGPAEVGDVLRVWEMGGTLAGETVRVHGSVPLASIDGDPLLFLERHGDDGHHVVGMTQGAFRQLEDGAFVSVAEGRPELLLTPDSQGRIRLNA